MDNFEAMSDKKYVMIKVTFIKFKMDKMNWNREKPPSITNNNATENLKSFHRAQMKSKKTKDVSVAANEQKYSQKYCHGYKVVTAIMSNDKKPNKPPTNNNFMKIIMEIQLCKRKRVANYSKLFSRYWRSKNTYEDFICTDPAIPNKITTKFSSRCPYYLGRCQKNKYLENLEFQNKVFRQIKTLIPSINLNYKKRTSSFKISFKDKRNCISYRNLFNKAELTAKNVNTLNKPNINLRHATYFMPSMFPHVVESTGMTSPPVQMFRISSKLVPTKACKIAKLNYKNFTTVLDFNHVSFELAKEITSTENDIRYYQLNPEGNIPDFILPVEESMLKSQKKVKEQNLNDSIEDKLLYMEGADNHELTMDSFAVNTNFENLNHDMNIQDFEDLVGLNQSTEDVQMWSDVKPKKKSTRSVESEIENKKSETGPTDKSEKISKKTSSQHRSSENNVSSSEFDEISIEQYLNRSRFGRMAVRSFPTKALSDIQETIQEKYNPPYYQDHELYRDKDISTFDNKSQDYSLLKQNVYEIQKSVSNDENTFELESLDSRPKAKTIKKSRKKNALDSICEDSICLIRDTDAIKRTSVKNIELVTNENDKELTKKAGIVKQSGRHSIKSKKSEKTKEKDKKHKEKKEIIQKENEPITKSTKKMKDVVDSEEIGLNKKDEKPDFTNLSPSENLDKQSFQDRKTDEILEISSNTKNKDMIKEEDSRKVEEKDEISSLKNLSLSEDSLFEIGKPETINFDKEILINKKESFLNWKASSEMFSQKMSENLILEHKEIDIKFPGEKFESVSKNKKKDKTKEGDSKKIDESEIITILTNLSFSEKSVCEIGKRETIQIDKEILLNKQESLIEWTASTIQYSQKQSDTKSFENEEMEKDKKQAFDSVERENISSFVNLNLSEYSFYEMEQRELLKIDKELLENKKESFMEWILLSNQFFEMIPQKANTFQDEMNKKTAAKLIEETVIEPESIDSQTSDQHKDKVEIQSAPLIDGKKLVEEEIKRMLNELMEMELKSVKVVSFKNAEKESYETIYETAKDFSFNFDKNEEIQSIGFFLYKDVTMTEGAILAKTLHRCSVMEAESIRSHSHFKNTKNSDGLDVIENKIRKGKKMDLTHDNLTDEPSAIDDENYVILNLRDDFRKLTSMTVQIPVIQEILDDDCIVVLKDDLVNPPEKTSRLISHEPMLDGPADEIDAITQMNLQALKQEKLSPTNESLMNQCILESDDNQNILTKQATTLLHSSPDDMKPSIINSKNITPDELDRSKNEEPNRDPDDKKILEDTPLNELNLNSGCGKNTLNNTAVDNSTKIDMKKSNENGVISNGELSDTRLSKPKLETIIPDELDRSKNEESNRDPNGKKILEDIPLDDLNLNLECGKSTLDNTAVDNSTKIDMKKTNENGVISNDLPSDKMISKPKQVTTLSDGHTLEKSQNREEIRKSDDKKIAENLPTDNLNLKPESKRNELDITAVNSSTKIEISVTNENGVISNDVLSDKMSSKSKLGKRISDSKRFEHSLDGQKINNSENKRISKDLSIVNLKQESELNALDDTIAKETKEDDKRSKEFSSDELIYKPKQETLFPDDKPLKGKLISAKLENSEDETSKMNLSENKVLGELSKSDDFKKNQGGKISNMVSSEKKTNKQQPLPNVLDGKSVENKTNAKDEVLSDLSSESITSKQKSLRVKEPNYLNKENAISSEQAEISQTNLMLDDSSSVEISTADKMNDRKHQNAKIKENASLNKNRKLSDNSSLDKVNMKPKPESTLMGNEKEELTGTEKTNKLKEIPDQLSLDERNFPAKHETRIMGTQADEIYYNQDSIMKEKEVDTFVNMPSDTMKYRKMTPEVIPDTEKEASSLNKESIRNEKTLLGNENKEQHTIIEEKDKQYETADQFLSDKITFQTKSETRIPGTETESGSINKEPIRNKKDDFTKIMVDVDVELNSIQDNESRDTNVISTKDMPHDTYFNGKLETNTMRKEYDMQPELNEDYGNSHKDISQSVGVLTDMNYQQTDGKKVPIQDASENQEKYIISTHSQLLDSIKVKSVDVHTELQPDPKLTSAYGWIETDMIQLNSLQPSTYENAENVILTSEENKLNFSEARLTEHMHEAINIVPLMSRPMKNVVPENVTNNTSYGNQEHEDSVEEYDNQSVNVPGKVSTGRQILGIVSKPPRTSKTEKVQFNNEKWNKTRSEEELTSKGRFRYYESLVDVFSYGFHTYQKMKEMIRDILSIESDFYDVDTCSDMSSSVNTETAEQNDIQSNMNNSQAITKPIKKKKLNKENNSNNSLRANVKNAHFEISNLIRIHRKYLRKRMNEYDPFKYEIYKILVIEQNHVMKYKKKFVQESNHLKPLIVQSKGPKVILIFIESKLTCQKRSILFEENLSHMFSDS